MGCKTQSLVAATMLRFVDDSVVYHYTCSIFLSKILLQQALMTQCASDRRAESTRLSPIRSDTTPGIHRHSPPHRLPQQIAVAVAVAAHVRIHLRDSDSLCSLFMVDTPFACWALDCSPPCGLSLPVLVYCLLLLSIIYRGTVGV